MAWGKNGTPNTLLSALPNVEITDLSSKKFNQILSHNFASTNTEQHLTFNNNTNAVYAKRQSGDGGADQTTLSATKYDMRWFITDDHFHMLYTCFISGEEKLSIGFTVTHDSAGAGTAPHRYEWAFKFVPSPDSDFTNVKFNKGAQTNFATGSNLTAIGTD